MEEHLGFIKITLLLILMFIVAVSLRRFNIPPIVSFLFVGFGAKLWLEKESTHLLDLFKEAGIILLFFFIGLEYSIERLKNVMRIWKPALIDLAINFLPIFFLAKAFGFSTLTSLLIAGVFYPSSTSIVAKLLMDFKRLASPEAELLIGILIFEDLFAIILISLMIPLKEAGSLDPIALPMSLLKMALVFGVFLVLHNYFMPRISSFLDRISEDENFVFFILGAVLLAGYSFKVLGLSEVLGAFLAGVLIHEGRAMHNIERHLIPFKELSIGIFFFFFAFESELTLPENLYAVIVLSIAGIFLKIASTWWAAILYGMKRRSALRTALSFVPRGEFSVVIASFDPLVRTFSIPFIFTSAILGSFLFALAPRIAEALVKKAPSPRSKVSSKPPQA
jgi:CPA2 family monovalent cation:H+ antiporter-2